MEIVKNGKNSGRILTRCLQREIDQYARVLRNTYEARKWIHKTRKPLDHKAIQLKIDILKKAEVILDAAAENKAIVKRLSDREDQYYRPGFMAVRRDLASAVCRAEARRLSLFLKRHPPWRAGKGRPSEALWGYRSNCLANFLREKTGAPHWDIVGDTLIRYFPEVYKPPDCDSVGLWACQLAKRFRQLVKNDYDRYLEEVMHRAT